MPGGDLNGGVSNLEHRHDGVREAVVLSGGASTRERYVRTLFTLSSSMAAISLRLLPEPIRRRISSSRSERSAALF
jgi:hypothetical protein